MDKPIDSLFGAQADETPAELVAALAPPAAAGHFDELRGGVSAPLEEAASATSSVAPHAAPTGAWGRFFDLLGPAGFADLNRRTTSLERQVRDNGVTYNVYADAGGPQRPWSLDLFPLIIEPASWAQIEAGVLQRVKLLDRIMADVYGPQQLLETNLLPPALVQGHPGYLRAMHGVKPAGGTHLHIAAFDMMRDPQGDWWVVFAMAPISPSASAPLPNATLPSPNAVLPEPPAKLFAPLAVLPLPTAVARSPVAWLQVPKALLEKPLASLP